jgi:acyl-CoA dehydrogenase
MDFSVPTSVRALLPELRTFIEQEVEPLEDRMHEGFFAIEPALNELRHRARANGWWLPQISKTHGGMGLCVLEHALVSEVLGRTPFGHYVLGCQAPDAGNMEILIEFGTPTQRERWLDPLLDGRTRSCFAMTEPDRAGSNPVWLGTTARRDGSDFVLDGHKWFTTAADGAAFAIVMAVTEPAAAPHERASMLIVPTDTAGFELVRNIPIMGEAGQGWMSHAEVRFDGARVPADHVLGAPGRGFAIAQARLGPGRIHHCMRWMGICDRAFGAMVERAATRELAPGDVLGTRQTVQNWIAESRAEIESARLLVLKAAWTIDDVGAKAAREDISLIKFHASEVLMRVVDRAIQVHGALGMTDDLVLSHFYRHERAARIYDGPDEVHKSVVARRILERLVGKGKNA